MRGTKQKCRGSKSVSKKMLAYLCLLSFVVVFLLLAWVPHDHDGQKGIDESCGICSLFHSVVKIAFVKTALLGAGVAVVAELFYSLSFSHSIQSLIALKARMNN